MPGNVSLAVCEAVYECFGITTTYLPEAGKITHELEAEFEVSSDVEHEWLVKLYK